MLEKYKMNGQKSIKEAIKALDKNEGKVVFIVDEDDILQGIFTQGDMRKYILESGDITKSIKHAMNSRPVTYTTIAEAKAASIEKKMVVYPVIDSKGRLIDALFERMSVEENKSQELKHIPLVIMAGGKGTRLYPYTKILPKALIPIGEVTISERIIHSFQNYGCQEVFFVLKHKGNMIRSYYEDIEKEYKVEYIEEKEFLGTGGGLSLLKGKINSTFFVSNCDVLLDSDFECIMKTHIQQQNKITFVCAMKEVVIPYGIVQTNEHGKIMSMREKPEFSFLTNTGVYVIEPEIIDNLVENEFIHLPDIAKRLIEQGERVGVFPISEKSWMDMGQFSSMESMLQELGI
ncbi:MAG: sugar phosphate nucleotidyltransferase [Lachnospiraceae bacterium]